MSLAYRNPDKNYNKLLTEAGNAKGFEVNYGRNRFAVLESKKKEDFKDVLDATSAEKLLKELKVEWDAIEDMGGGCVYTLKGAIVAQYDPQFANVSIYRDLESSLPKAEDKSTEVKHDHVTEGKAEQAKQLIIRAKEALKSSKSAKELNSIAGALYKLSTNSSEKDITPGLEDRMDSLADQLYDKAEKLSSTKESFNEEDDAIVSVGVTDKTVADDIAAKNDGSVKVDNKDPNKFMVVKKNEAMGDWKDVQHAKKDFQKLNQDPMDDANDITQIKGYVADNVFDWKHDIDELMVWCGKMRKRGAEIYQYDSQDDQYVLFAIKKQLSEVECAQYNLTYFDEGDLSDDFEDPEYMDEAKKIFEGQNDVEGLRRQIKKASDSYGESRNNHTIISMGLNQLGSRYGKDARNKAVKDFNLDVHGFTVKEAQIQKKISQIQAGDILRDERSSGMGQNKVVKIDPPKNGGVTLYFQDGSKFTYNDDEVLTVVTEEYQSPFQEEGQWSEQVSEDCTILPGEKYQMADGELFSVDRVEGETIFITTAAGNEESMQYEEFDHLLHAGQMRKLEESKLDELAEKAFVMHSLLQKPAGTLTEKQKEFISENLKVELSEQDRAIVERIVVKKYGSFLIKEKKDETAS